MNLIIELISTPCSSFCCSKFGYDKVQAILACIQLLQKVASVANFPLACKFMTGYAAEI